MSELLINDIKSNNSELKSYNEEMQIIEEMAEVLKDYTARNHIMASHVILDCYAEELYSKNYRKQEWISVDERLPEEAGEYLIISKLGVVYLAPYSSRYRAFNATNDDDGDRWRLNDITHWMPLPEAPKMKGDSDAR